MDVYVLKVEFPLLPCSDSIENGLHFPFDVNQLSPLVEHLSSKLFSASSKSFLFFGMQFFNSHQCFVFLFSKFSFAKLFLLNFVLSFIHELCECSFDNRKS